MINYQPISEGNFLLSSRSLFLRLTREDTVIDPQILTSLERVRHEPKLFAVNMSVSVLPKELRIQTLTTDLTRKGN